MIQSKYHMIFDTDVLQDQIETYFEAFSRRDVYEHTCDVLSTYNKIVELLDVSEPLKTKGRVAALLHDIGRVVDYSELVKFCEENGRFASENELKAIGVLHQFASKYIAMHIFGIEDEMILNAIECHTTLKGNPSIVDKLVFLSDKLSWKEEESAELIRKMKTQLTISIDLSLYEYHKVMYDNREAMMCYHEWSNDAYHYLREALTS